MKQIAEFYSFTDFMSNSVIKIGKENLLKQLIIKDKFGLTVSGNKEKFNYPIKVYVNQTS